MHTHIKRLPLACALAAGSFSLPAIAQNDDFSDFSLLEEIVVTAQKREMGLQETPIAVTAFSSDQLSDLGINSQQDIANFTPSMSYQESAGGNEGNRIYMRGVGRETNATGTEPGVGLYDNGFYTNESGILAASPDRIERIEILRGPQGTLYGRNTTGGAINVIAKRPSKELEGTIRLNAGEYGAMETDITVSGPVSDKVALSMHYNRTEADSLFTNVSGADPYGLESNYFETQIEVDFTENVNWHFRYANASYTSETLEFIKLSEYKRFSPLKLGELVVNPEIFASEATNPSVDDPFTISSDFNGTVSVDGSHNYQSTLSIELDSMTIRMLNGFAEYEWYGEKDYDGIAGAVSYVESIGQNEESTQHEIQLISNGDGPVSWVAGLFYFKNDLEQPYGLHDFGNPYLANPLNIANGTFAPVSNPLNHFYYQTGELTAETTALYGEVTWDASESLVITAGLRYGEDEKSGYEEQNVYYDTLGCGFVFYQGFPLDNSFQPVDYSAYLFGGNPLADACPADFNPRFTAMLTDADAEHSESWDSVTWRLNASYELNDNSRVYATVSTGYKTGGFRLGGMQDDPTTEENESIVGEENLVAYEAGYKGMIGENLRINAAAYFYDYSDMQVELDILDPESGIVNNRLANAPDVEVYGFEFETTWAVTEKFTVLANYSYNKSEIVSSFQIGDNKTYDAAGNAQVRDVKGNELNRSPRSKLAIGGFYVQPFDAGTMIASVTYASIDQQYVSLFNDDIESIDDYGKVDARLAWNDADGNWEFAVYGDNLTDELSYANAWSVSNQQDGNRLAGRPISPRTFGAEVVFSF